MNREAQRVWFEEVGPPDVRRDDGYWGWAGNAAMRYVLRERAGSEAGALEALRSLIEEAKMVAMGRMSGEGR